MNLRLSIYKQPRLKRTQLHEALMVEATKSRAAKKQEEKQTTVVRATDVSPK